MAEEFFELVWEDGQLLIRGLPKSTQKSPTCNGRISPSSNGDHFKNGGDSTFPPKSAKFRIGDSILGESRHDNKKDFYVNITHSDLPLDDNHHESLPELYQRPFNEFSEQDRGSRYDKLLKDSQVVPVHESANLKPKYAYNHVPCQPEQFTLRQDQVSAPRKRPRVNPSPNLASWGASPSSKSQQQFLETEMKRETPNFSLFLRSPVATSSQGFTKADVLKNNGKTSGSGRFKPSELAHIVQAGTASNMAKGYQSQLNTEEANVRLSSSIAKSPDKSLPDVQSEAVCPDDRFKNKRSSTHQVCDRTSSLPVNTVKRNLTTEKSIEPPVASSSFCSRGASNNPTYTLKRRYEETDGSAYPSDENVEEKQASVKKRVSDRCSKGNRKRRTAASHNLYERKRRDKIDKKMQALQDLIPNCNKVDKVSILDEAIEYLKSLQLQVLIMSMGTGVCMPPPIMLPKGMQQIHAPPMAHFSPLGVGMGMKRQMGVVCSSQQFLIPPIPGATAIPGLAETRIQMPGFPGLPLPMFRPPLGLMHKTVPMAAISRPSASMELVNSAPIINSNVSIQNAEVNNKTFDRFKLQSSGLPLRND